MTKEKKMSFEETDKVFIEMKKLVEELIKISSENGLSLIISFETNKPHACYVGHVGTTNGIGHVINYFEKVIEKSTRKSMRALKELGYEYDFYRSRKTKEVSE